MPAPLMADRSTGLWICEDCGYRYQKREHLENHLKDCYQFNYSKGGAPTPEGTVHPAQTEATQDPDADEPTSDKPVSGRKRKES